MAAECCRLRASTVGQYGLTIYERHRRVRRREPECHLTIDLGGGIEPPTADFQSSPIASRNTHRHLKTTIKGDPPLDRGRWMLLGDAQPRQPGLSMQTWEGGGARVVPVY